MRPLTAKLRRLFGQKAGAPAEDQHYLVSIVVLRKKYVPITTEQLEGHVKAAYGVALDDSMPLNAVRAITSHSFLVKLGGEMLQVSNSARPYSPDPEKDAADFPTEEWQAAWREHRSWISVDHLAGSARSGEERLQMYPMLGELASQLIDENTLGMYAPGPTEKDPPKFRPIDAELRDDLAGN